MNRLGFLAAVAFAVMPAFAETEREYLWPDGKMPDAQPHQIGATTTEVTAPQINAESLRTIR